jgi:hypothetical protein
MEASTGLELTLNSGTFRLVIFHTGRIPCSIFKWSNIWGLSKNAWLGSIVLWGENSKNYGTFNHNTFRIHTCACTVFSHLQKKFVSMKIIIKTMVCSTSNWSSFSLMYSALMSYWVITFIFWLWWMSHNRIIQAARIIGLDSSTLRQFDEAGEKIGRHHQSSSRTCSGRDHGQK